ncbi:MAG: hypothetical protein RJA22_2984 [Verrucomicrobiota bacterium]
MTRTIRLTGLHAINWYGYKDSIRVDGNLLLAGVTGSGKSILMDLVQLVLVGDQRLVRFNQSATGDRSDRSLKGYCLGDTKQEENGVTQYMRSSAITYVALEFTWPNRKRRETWGLRIEFGSAAEAQGKVTPFFIPAALQRSQFLDADKRPLDYPGFKALVEEAEGRLYTEGLEAYLRDMAQPTHLNFDRAVLRALLPTAMSFTFLKSFNEFARNFILPADRLDIGDVTASYRTFVRYEEDLRQLDDQFQRLKSIRDCFQRLSDLRRDRALARHLEAETRLQDAAAQLAAAESELATLRKEYAAEEKRLQELDREIPELQRRLGGLAATINETPEGRLYSELKSRNETLARRLEQLREIGASLEQALARRVRNAQAWLKELRGLPLELEAASVQALERAIQSVVDRGTAHAGETLPALQTAAQGAVAAAGRAAKPTLDRLAELRRQLGQLRDEVKILALGRLPGGQSRLLDALNQRLPSRGQGLPARHLRDLCEVTDERWRPALEVAFTRKFAVVVSPEDYPEAERIYHSLKATDLGGETGRESLVNPAKALARTRAVQPGSLAEKLATNHPVAQALIADAFGGLVCVERREDLRAHDFAIMPDGFMTRGAFVERPRFYDGHPFIGQKGLQQQLAWKERQVSELAAEERRLAPVERALKDLQESWNQRFEDVAQGLYNDLAEARALPTLEAELQDNLAKLKRIDRSKFDELAREQKKLEATLRKHEEERRELDRSGIRLRVQELEQAVNQSGAAVQRLQEEFDQVRHGTDVSPWLARLQELRAEILGQFPALDVAAREFGNRYHRCDREEAERWMELQGLRRALGAAHPKFDDLPVEAPDNDAHARQLARLEESEIPEYRAKAEHERRNWEKLFRTQVLEKLHHALQEVKNLIALLNTALRKRPIGTNTYQLHHRRNPDYQLYHELLEASALVREDDLFFASADQRFRDAINHFLRTLIESDHAAEATRLLDYRHYFEYDMEVLEADGRKTSVDRHSGKFSGGENQSPYFIAILASYLRAYRRYSARKPEPSLGLVPIDEAFSKLSGERIKDCIAALQAFDLQGLFSMSTGNIPYAFEHCDWLVVVSKEERRLGQRTEIRNIPVSLAREAEDARRLMAR